MTSEEENSKLLSILEKRWNDLNDEQRWKALLSGDEVFSKLFIVNLDNDSTFMTLKHQLNEEQEDFILHFDEYIGWSDGVQSLLKAANIKSEPV